MPPQQSQGVAMKEDIGFHIGKEGSPLDKPPFRAYFYWIKEGQIVKYEDFTLKDLETEIASGKRESRELELFKEALNRLTLSAQSCAG
jgi:hypothetical protein